MEALLEALLIAPLEVLPEALLGSCRKLGALLEELREAGGAAD